MANVNKNAGTDHLYLALQLEAKTFKLNDLVQLKGLKMKLWNDQIGRIVGPFSYDDRRWPVELIEEQECLALRTKNLVLYTSDNPKKISHNVSQNNVQDIVRGLQSISLSEFESLIEQIIDDDPDNDLDQSYKYMKRYYFTIMGYCRTYTSSIPDNIILLILKYYYSNKFLKLYATNNISQLLQLYSSKKLNPSEYNQLYRFNESDCANCNKLNVLNYVSSFKQGLADIDVKNEINDNLNEWTATGNIYKCVNCKYYIIYQIMLFSLYKVTEYFENQSKHKYYVSHFMHPSGINHSIERHKKCQFEGGKCLFCGSNEYTFLTQTRSIYDYNKLYYCIVCGVWRRTEYWNPYKQNTNGN